MIDAEGAVGSAREVGRRSISTDVVLSRRRAMIGLGWGLGMLGNIGMGPNRWLRSSSAHPVEPFAIENASPNPKNLDQAMIAITLDLEMSRNFPDWKDTHWDYEKGNLTQEVKQYSVDVCRRVKDRGGLVHTFVVGRVLEQADVDWLREIHSQGHPIGNHTYDHVNVCATHPEEIQFRFARAPWLIEGQTVAEVLRQNIRLTNLALEQRIGTRVAGFRTPGGFANGLHGREDVQRMLLESGFSWISCTYPSHAGIEDLHGSSRLPSHDAFQNIVEAQRSSQPFVYPTGLWDIPMSPISDIGAFRGGGWKLDSFLKAVQLAVEWCIENRAVFDFLAHPSCLGVVDPSFRTIDLICDLIDRAGDRARLCTLNEIAQTFAGPG